MKEAWSLLLMGILLVTACNKISTEQKEQAKELTVNWLTLMDEQQYDQAYADTADYFKNVINRDQFIAQMKGVHGPLGKVNSRKVKSVNYANQLPGAPDGAYIVVKFDTEMENKKDTLETVTLMKEGEMWKVSGYYIN